MNKIWPIIYVALIPIAIFGGYRVLDSEAVSRTNADWVFVSIAFILLTLFPLVAAGYGFKHAPGGYLRRPSWNRGPLGWWTDTLQPLRVSIVAMGLYVLGALFELPHADQKGRMMFLFLLAAALGLFVGERLVYGIYKRKIQSAS